MLHLDLNLHVAIVHDVLRNRAHKCAHAGCLTITETVMVTIKIFLDKRRITKEELHIGCYDCLIKLKQSAKGRTSLLGS